MAIIATLETRVKADTSRFVKGMKKAQKRLRRFRQGVARTVFRLARFGGAMAAIATGAMVLLIRQSLKMIDTNTKLADRIGATTETVVALQHAAEITGVSSEKMRKSLDFMGKSLGEVKLGLGEAKTALEAMNVNVDDLLAMKPGKQFEALAEAISKLPTQAEKSAVAMKIFGRSGIALVNTLSLGRTGLQQMRAEAELLGLTFSESAGRRVEDANDAFTRLKAAFQGLGNVLAVEVAPFIKTLADGIVNAIASAGGMKKIVGNFKTFAIETGDTMLDFIQDIQLFWENVILSAETALETFLKIANVIEKILPSAQLQTAFGFGGGIQGLLQQTQASSAAREKKILELANAPRFSELARRAREDRAFVGPQSLANVPIPLSPTATQGMSPAQADMMIQEMRQLRLGIIG